MEIRNSNTYVTITEHPHSLGTKGLKIHKRPGLKLASIAHFNQFSHALRATSRFGNIPASFSMPQQCYMMKLNLVNWGEVSLRWRLVATAVWLHLNVGLVSSIYTIMNIGPWCSGCLKTHSSKVCQRAEIFACGATGGCTGGIAAHRKFISYVHDVAFQSWTIKADKTIRTLVCPEY